MGTGEWLRLQSDVCRQQQATDTQWQILAYLILGSVVLALVHLVYVVGKASIKSYKVSIANRPSLL